MNDTAVRSSGSAVDRLRQRRRELIKLAGRRFVRTMKGFLANQSTVANPVVFEPGTFPEVDALDAHWATIRREVDAVIEHTKQLPRLQDISPDQGRIATDDRWRSFVFYGFGKKAHRNCALCPETTRLIEAIPQLENAWLSILLPGYHVPKHKGITRGIVTALYGVQIPKNREMCSIRIADETYHYDEGRSIVFDDMRSHEIRNDTDEIRAVLIVDFRRPMRFAGRFFNALFLFAFKRTGYVREAERNHRMLEERFHAHLAGQVSGELGPVR